MREIGVGLLGFGTIGAGVVQGLLDNKTVISERLGAVPVMRAIADLDIKTDRGVVVDPAILTTDAFAVVVDPAIDIVIELIGGTTIAKDLVIKALEQGKHVVTANKSLLAKYGKEIFEVAAANSTDIYYGASVGGGIPIIKVMREALAGNNIENIYAILNGTCNYILTQMEEKGMPFDEALDEAKVGAYAEADPTLDIDGHDTAHKAVLLASLAYGFNCPLESVSVEGIRSISPEDISLAKNLGYRIKLLAVIKGHQNEVEVRVHPSLVAHDHVLASINGVFNGVAVEGDLVGRSLYYGRGAGREPTASTVIGDIVDISRNMITDSSFRVPAMPHSAKTVTVNPIENIETRYYIRMMVADKSGVMADIARAFGDRNISIASALQQGDCKDGYVSVVYMSHEAKESDIKDALAEIEAMDFLKGAPVILRIEG